MSAPPDTVVVASREEAEAIRSAVRDPDLAALGPGRVVAGPEHAQALADLLADPAVSDPVYDLPRPITAENVAAECRRRGFPDHTAGALSALVRAILDERRRAGGAA